MNLSSDNDHFKLNVLTIIGVQECFPNIKLEIRMLDSDELS